jgi:hypothetical protein
LSCQHLSPSGPVVLHLELELKKCYIAGADQCDGGIPRQNGLPLQKEIDIVFECKDLQKA